MDDADKREALGFVGVPQLEARDMGTLLWVIVSILDIFAIYDVMSSGAGLGDQGRSARHHFVDPVHRRGAVSVRVSRQALFVTRGLPLRDM